MNWETVIGLEVHTQLATESKIFSSAPCEFGQPANTQACNIDLALPGTLPVLNKAVLAMAVKFGLSVNADINHCSVFARKNYFYPDSPKGYQISQHNLPIVGQGQINIMVGGQQKTIGITRAHLEEDAGKSIHGILPGQTGIDLNRAGTPLLEIVSEPDMRNAEEAVAYLKTMRTLVRYLGISDGNMQEGSFRCDVNISLRPKGQAAFGTRVELKNLNSFRFVEQAIHCEIERQQDILENNGAIIQETRLYDPDRNETRSMREKEEAMDYRYFNDPDLLPVILEKDLVSAVKADMPELPWEKQSRYQQSYQLSEEEARTLSQSISLAQFFENSIGFNDLKISPKAAANWILGELNAALNKQGLSLSQSPITPERLAELLARIDDNTISNSIAKKVFHAMLNGEGDADTIIDKQGLKQITDSDAIEKVIDEIIANNPEQLADFRAGKEKLFSYFVGQAMRATKGKANPKQVNDLLKQKLKGE